MKRLAIVALAMATALPGAASAQYYSRDQLVLYPCGRYGGPQGHSCPGAFIGYHTDPNWVTVDWSLRSDWGDFQRDEIRALDWTIGTAVTCQGVSGTISAITGPRQVDLTDASGTVHAGNWLYRCHQ